MKRYVVLALLASTVGLAIAETADAGLFRRRSRNCGSCNNYSNCGSTGNCGAGGCAPAYSQHQQWQDPNMGVQHGSVQPGQQMYGQQQIYGQPTPAQGGVNYNAQPMPPAPQRMSTGQVQGSTQFDARSANSSSEQINGNQQEQPRSVNDATRGDNPVGTNREPGVTDRAN